VSARKDTLRYRAGKLVKRNKAAMIAGSAAVVLTAGLGLLLLRSGMPLLNPVPLPPKVTPFTTFQGAETQPAFSPDGSRIAFVWGGEDGNSDIYVRPITGGELQRITTDVAEDVSPVWSPDGTRIAFLRTKNNETAVFIAPLPNGVHAKITDVFPARIEAVGRHLDWSPDGRYLALADKNSVQEPFGIYLVRMADGQKQRLTFPPAESIGDFSPAFSPDGKWISFLRAPSSGITELYIAPLAGGEPRQLTHDQREALAQCWTPDSHSIVFASSRVGNFNLWRIAASGGVPIGIPGIAEGASEPTFSRDGRYLAYSSSFQDANIWRIDLSAQPVKHRILISSTQYDSSAQFSPDGGRIAFRSNRSGYHEVWVSGSDGRNQNQLTHFGGTLAGTPRWSPDGRWIAFDARPEGQADIFVISAEGGTPRRLTFEPTEDVVPSWSRDGKWIYCASHRSGTWQVWKTPAEGGAGIQVTQHGGFAAFESADGKYLYYAKGRTEGGLYRMPTAGGEEMVVLDRLKPGYWGYWALANDGIYFADGPGIYFFRFQDKRIRQISTVEKGLTIGDSSMALSPDGRTLLYTQIDQSGADIMLAEMR
jgi:Tol biopolymer transport system component